MKENSKDDTFIISEEYIKQLEKELQMDNKIPQGNNKFLIYSTNEI